MPLPFEGVRVLEVANFFAAPACGALLADLGADVVKVEAPGGDSMRYVIRQPGEPATGKPVPLGSRFDYVFNTTNRGKRSVCVDLAAAEGQRLVRTLAEDCDVFLTNLTPERLRKYGMGPEQVRKVNPRCVYAAVSGWGLTGPLSDGPGFDMTAFFARGGYFVAHQSDPAQQPQPARPAVGDFTTALSVFGAVASALRLRDRTGEGSVVDASLLRTSAWVLAADLSATLVDGRAFRPPPRTTNPLVGHYRMGCGRWVMLCMPFPRFWPALCRAVGRPAWADEYRDAKARARAGPRLVAELGEIFASRPLSEWARTLDEHKLTWAPCQDLADVAKDPQHAAIGTFATIDGPHGEIRTVAAPFSISAAEPHAPRVRAPEPGEHTAAVLRAAGVGDAELRALSANGTIGFRPEQAPEPLRRWHASRARL